MLNNYTHGQFNMILLGNSVLIKVNKKSNYLFKFYRNYNKN